MLYRIECQKSQPKSRNIKKHGNRYYKCVYCQRRSGISGYRYNTLKHMKNCKQKPFRANVQVDIINGRVDKETFDTLPQIIRGNKR